MSALKQQLLNICFTYVNKRIANYKDEIETIKESLDSNDKSSDEDDDSGNGKLLNDLEKNAQYLSDAHKMLETLKLINPNTVHQNIVLGSLVHTNNANFYIAISIGKVDVDGQDYYIISKSSPIGEQLLNKTSGDTVTFNATSYTIASVK